MESNPQHTSAYKGNPKEWTLTLFEYVFVHPFKTQRLLRGRVIKFVEFGFIA
jgi:hypothetical protein